MELSYPYICVNQSEIPEKALEHIDKSIIDRVGGSFAELFPLFAQTFIETTQVIERDWSSPKLVLKKGVRQWLINIVVQSETHNLFFKLQPEFMDKDGEFFEENHLMLPKSWREVYRWFDSFCVTKEGYCVMNWWNTPFRYAGRLDLDDYEDGSGASRAQTEQFAKTIGCKREKLRCWLLTENEDALFINEEACDGKVFHVNGKELDDITEILNPQKKLDEYLTHYLSGKSPKTFNWRSY